MAHWLKPCSAAFRFVKVISMVSSGSGEAPFRAANRA
jgi:hypothetical protein